VIEKKADLEIIDIKPRGYCKGVIRALSIVKRTREENPETTISILGKIVHNRYITEALNYYRIKTIDIPGLTREELLQYVDQGILILSAHGTGKRIVEIAKAKGLTVIDAVCNDVVSTHDIIGHALAQDTQIVFIGKNMHPETEAILQNFPRAHLITQESDINILNLDSTKNILITNQTTLSILEIQSIIQAILDKYPQAEVNNEICGATRVRQEAIIKQSKLDALVVVGDPNSNNTAMLAQIGFEHGIKHVVRIESIEDLMLDGLKQGWRVGITSGASTPTYLTEMVSHYLKNVDLTNPQRKPEIDLTKILE
jgi:4-hydroxy-3-methylbut-2-enyl diphosphate reductase